MSKMFERFFNEINKNHKKEIEITETFLEERDTSQENVLKKIRDQDIKIKNVFPTSFGIEIEFFNRQDAQKAKDLINTSKIKDKSIFVDLY